METTNTGIIIAATDHSSSYGIGPSAPWLGRRFGFAVAAGAVAAATALALRQHWLGTADLAPLLYVLPCAVMMFMCMKNHQAQPSAAPASTPTATPSTTDPRN